MVVTKTRIHRGPPGPSLTTTVLHYPLHIEHGGKERRKATERAMQVAQIILAA